MINRPLGFGPLRVSPLSLGSWKTFERIGFDAALAVLRTALDEQITFLDDARYTSETPGAEPSEVLFGRLIAASGVPRDEFVIANKLWWEFWPREDARAELGGSLQRMGLDHVDLIYAVTLPPPLTVVEAVHEVGGLLAEGLARSWGVANWTGVDLAHALEQCDRQGVARPVAAQQRYSLIDRGDVENPAMRVALSDGPVSLVPSSVLAGGILSGRYAADPVAAGRMTRTHRDAAWATAHTAAAQLAALAAELDAEPAALAIVFALDGPGTASVLFGASTPEQVRANVSALRLHEQLDAGIRARLAAIGAGDGPTAT